MTEQSNPVHQVNHFIRFIVKGGNKKSLKAVIKLEDLRTYLLSSEFSRETNDLGELTERIYQLTHFQTSISNELIDSRKHSFLQFNTLMSTLILEINRGRR